MATTNARTRPESKRERGQALALFVLLSFVIIGAAAIVTDAGGILSHCAVVAREYSIPAVVGAKRATAVLRDGQLIEVDAGAVYLPGNPANAYAVARAEATKNGYTGGAGVTITPTQDPRNPRRLDVSITAPVNTFFAQIFGLRTVDVTQSSRAEYTLPVPMGSPQNYFGIYQLISMNSGAIVTNGVSKAPGASGATQLASQGFWAAVLTRGANRSNGDAYSPANNGGSANTDFDPNGYDYTIDFGAGTTSGRVYLYDAPFCAVGHAPSGSYLGTGDHWIGTGGTPVTTQYILWNTRNTPYDKSDDFKVADTLNTFANNNQVDKSTAFTGDGRYGDDGYTGTTSADCQGDLTHNGWYQLAQNLPAGSYRLQVTTSSVSNANTNAENMFGIQAVPGAGNSAQVHGTDRMAMYNNLNGGTSTFYLAQIDKVHAGKTMSIRLFDPGDVGGDAVMRIKRPTTTGYVDATFSYTADNGRSGNNVTYIQTASGGTNLYNNSWITITVPLPNTYGQAGDTLQPPGETQPGWWKVEYTITAAGNDTTTWEVTVLGNPVHLVVP